ncbi:MAG: hypothetical protein IPJ81_09175 [Chitinophagaceae bacterium]|nr:hypothetical protein [Chitinophagaceae bacterium]
MRIFIRLYIIVMSLLCFIKQGFSQTSWTGAVSTSWSASGNWTAGVPTITQNAIIGDASFTGAFQPTIAVNAECANLTIGGAVASTLTVNKLLTISGNLTINSGATLSQGNTNIVIRGNWINSGTYTAINSVPLPTVFFAATNQTIGGSNVSTFRNLTVNPGSTVLLGININITSNLLVSGTIDPSESPTYQVSGGNITVTSGGVAKVNASTFGGNYSTTVILNEGSIVEYGSNTTAQSINASYTYSTLKISGSTVKSLSSGLPALNSTTASAGNIFVTAGSTFDLSSFSADRGTSVVGGILSIANNATLIMGGVGGTSPFPANFATVSLSLGSTVEYKSGAGTQIISPQTYGNLVLSCTSGTATKTSASAFTIAGNFTTTVGTGTALNFTAGANIAIDGNVTLGTSTTFNAESFTHTIKGNWANNGTFTGSTSTVNLAGSGTAMSGSGTNNFNNLTVSGFGITATNNAINISGDFGTSGPGTFVHASGGTVTMTGASKTIDGSGITLNNLTISSGFRTSTATLTLTGNLSATGTLTCSSGTISMSGLSNSISGAGAKSFLLYILWVMLSLLLQLVLRLPAH